MSKIITVDGTITNPTAPRILRTPGLTGYAARFIASHLSAPVGATLPGWVSVGGTVPTTLTKLGATPTVTIAEESGKRHVHFPGDSLNGGRLLGPHTTQRPMAMAAVVRMAAGTESFMGMTGTSLSRNAAGVYQGSNVSGTALSGVNKNGWMFVLLTQSADNTFMMRADSEESTVAAGTAASGSNGGFYLGATAAGDALDVREALYWPRALTPTERKDVHDYMRSRYPELT